MNHACSTLLNKQRCLTGPTCVAAQEAALARGLQLCGHLLPATARQLDLERQQLPQLGRLSKPPATEQRIIPGRGGDEQGTSNKLWRRSLPYMYAR